MPVSRARSIGLLLLLSALWAASYTFIRVGVRTIPPVTFIAGRTALAGAVLMGVLRGRGVRLPRDVRVWRDFLVQACLNSVVPFTLIAWGERTVEAGVSVILNSLAPVFTFLFMLFLAGERRPTAVRAAGVAIGLIGVALVVGLPVLRGFGHELWPQIAILLATACYGAAAIFGRRFRDLDPVLPAAGSMICGAAILLPLSLAVDRPWHLAPSVESLLALCALALLSTALAFVIYFHLIGTIGPVGTSAQAYMRVPIGVGLGAWLLGERLATGAWLGLLCVFCAVVAMTLPDAETSAGRKLVN